MTVLILDYCITVSEEDRVTSNRTEGESEASSTDFLRSKKRVTRDVRASLSCEVTARMESITESPAEIEYVRAVEHLKQTQKASKGGVAAAQYTLHSQGRKYGEELAAQMINEPHIVRKYAIGSKYVLEFITSAGSIVLYAHPRNSATKPKIDIMHAKYGHIAWWHSEDFKRLECGKIWEFLTREYEFDTNDTMEVDYEAARIRAMCAE